MKKVLLFSGLCGLSALLLLARSPGGVEGVDAWFKAAPVSGNLQGRYQWLDFSGDSVVQYAQNRVSGSYVFTQDRTLLKSLNFNPALDFSKGDTPKWSELRRSSLIQGTIIGVFAPYTFTTEGVVYGVASGDGGGSLVTSDQIVRPGSIEPLDYGEAHGEDLLYTGKDSIPENIFKEHATKVLTYYRAANPNTSVWGGPGGTLTIGGAYSSSDGHFNGPFDTSNFDNKGFEGYSPELLVYNRILTPGERRKAESYLAMKYGVTLNDSYLDGDGNLVWDRDDAGVYHNRVTAISRNRAGDFLQPMSATSYEEGPVYASLPENDSYHRANSYGLPSEAHLLVMGREYGNPMPDKLSVFWGDDGGALETYTSPNDTLWHIMNRTWLVKPNMPTVADTTATRWSGTGMTVTPEGFLDVISQAENTPGTVVTPELTDGTGFIGFQCPYSHPAFDVGFSKSGDSGCSYGFRIGSDGSVKAITGGEAGTANIVTDVSGAEISVMLSDGTVYLRIDGEGNAGYTVAIPEDARNSAYRGIISAESSANPLYLTSVRSNGAVETGYFAELAHNLTPEKEFYHYSRNRTVMLIDPTGEGRFDTGNTVMVRCTPPDISRGKTMFHNILWDADGSGSDMFTFAYFDGIDADVDVEPTTCVDGVPQKDGAIDIGINIGTPIYKYSLTVDSVAGMKKDDLVASGSFMGKTHRIENLATGTYTLTVTQGGGNDIHGKGNLLYTTYSHTDRRFTGGDVEWTVTETGSWYRIGAEPSVNEDITQWGYDVRGDKAYFILDGYTSLTQGVNIKPGDTLGLRISGIYVRWYHNGEEVLKKSAWTLRLWRMCIKYGRGDTHITGMTINGTPVEDFEIYGNVQIETPKTNTVAYTVHVGNGCDPSMPNGVEPKQPVVIGQSDPPGGDYPGNTRNSSLSVDAEDGTAHIFNAILDREQSGPATLMVFDASGRLVFEGEMEGSDIKTKRFTVPMNGVYIVKAITAEGEHTRKILAK